MSRTWYAITYDIHDNRLRSKVSELLLDHGARVQKSVFECHLTPDYRDTLWARLTDLIDPETDSLRMYALCAACWKRGDVAGQSRVTEASGLVVV